MANETKAAARQVAGHLAVKGHVEHAARLQAALDAAEGDLLGAVREACQTILTAIEAIDPVSAIMVEDLRLAVNARLRSSTP